MAISDNNKSSRGIVDLSLPSPSTDRLARLEEMARDLSKLVEGRPLTLLPTKAERSARSSGKGKQSEDTAGPAWFNMPAAVRTPELENDIRLLSMRSALDPKQHYRKGEKILQGKYFQVGTVVADPTGHYSERLTKRQRGQTILDTLMRDTDRQQYFKKKYSALQQANIQASRTPRIRKTPLPKRRSGSK